jgi:TPP-dependent 2-oxoacid decarboxylase
LKRLAEIGVRYMLGVQGEFNLWFLEQLVARALLHHTVADGSFESMLNCYREFTIAHARVEPDNAAHLIDSVLRASCLGLNGVLLLAS